MIVEIDIQELSEGHYVVDIVKQQASYALTNSGHIKNQQVVESLKRKGVLSVLIDTSKSESNQADNAQLSRFHDQQLPAIVEITKAKKLFNQSKQLQQQLLQDFASGEPVNLTPIVESSNQTLNAIYKNPDALACIINIREKSEYLLEHSVAVSMLMSIFAHYLALDHQISQQLALGAFLHDVGKVKIPDVLLNKRSKLTPTEYAIVKTHVNHSIELVRQIPGLSEISMEVVALHHERLNGSGYPYKLTADKISQYGRMIAICDVFDALISNKVHKNGYSHVQAFAILRKMGQKQELDIQLVDAFIKCLGVYPVGSLVELSSQKLAIVEARNLQDTLKPKVRSFYDLTDRRYIMTQDIDLSQSSEKILKGCRAEDYKLDMNKIIEFLMMQG